MVSILASPVAAQPAPRWNIYQSDTSLVVPYIDGPLNSRNPDGTFSNHTANLAIQIAGRSIPVTIDTGSTGVAISQALLPSGALNGLTPIGPGAINYDSSGATPAGFFYQLPVSILGGNVSGQAAVGTTSVKVLVVTNDNTTAYFGIGNNRNNVYSGAYNPSLTFAQNVSQGNITEIAAVGMNPLISVAVNGSALPNQGYVVMNNQIVVGLTKENNTYSFVKLTPATAAGPNLWNGIPVALSNGTGNSYVSGTILHDTGIFNAYLKPFVPAGGTVDISMPGMPPQGAFYSFVVPATGSTCGTASALTPCEVLGSTSSTPFLNTGRQFYSGFNYLFDPVNGYVGYALSNSGLTTKAQISPLLALQDTVGLPNDFATNLPTFLMGATTLMQAGTGTFSGDISGYGGLTISSGRVNLTGTNTYTGGTTVTGGAVLAINTDSGMGATAGGLTLNGGTLQALATMTVARQVTLGTGGGIFNTSSGNITLSAAVSGAGGLTKAGAGILTLSGANSYTGGTMVNAGTLRLGASAALPTTGALHVNGGIFDANDNNVTVGALSGTGGAILIGAGNLVAGDSSNTNLGAVITGTGGVVKQGTGTLSLSGVHNYTGPTAVAAGGLAVNGSITSNVTVGSAGNLGGSGTIFGRVVNNGGAVSPGNSIGTLNVVGAYAQTAGSTYQVETNSAGQADRLNVTGIPGTATINGGTVSLTAATGIYAPSTTYTILNATGGVTGAYAGANSLFPFLQPSLSYDSNNVYLTLRPGGFGAGAATANQAAVGRVLDQRVAGSSGDLATVIGAMATYTSSQGQAAMNAISGQNYSGFGTANLGGGLLFMNALGQQMGLARGGFGGGTRVAVAQACDVVRADSDACDGEASPWSLWGSALGGTGSVAGNANAGTLTYNAGGVATGFDYRFGPSLLAGVGVGFSSGNQWASGFSGQSTTNSYQASLYASFTPGAFYVDALAGYGYNDNQMTRQIVLPNLAARTAQGRTGANQFLAQVEAGYRIGIYEPAALSITPFARFQGTTNSQNGFTESGASALNLAVAAQTTGSARSVLGAEFAGAFGPEGREKLALQMRLGWAHEYANTARPVTASFAGAPGANFTVFGAAPQTDSAVVSLAASTAVAPGSSIYLRYDGEIGIGTSSHALNGGLRITW